MPRSPSNAAWDPQFNEVELPASVEIRESSVTHGQPGAFCKTLIKKDTRFGPYKGEIINPGQKADIDYRYAWEVFEKRRNVLKFTISASDLKASNWMRNVNCARFYEEQNIVSTQEGFSIFYIAMQDIKPGEELLTWFDPQLLKRTKRRASRGERRKVGYTIELVPWSDEKKFVPEIIETKRARKKKVLGEDMLSFEEDAALMQKSMNSMFRLPRKPESHPQPTRNSLQPHHVVKVQSNSESRRAPLKTSPPKPVEIKRDIRSTVDTTLPSSLLIYKEKRESLPFKPKVDIDVKKAETVSKESSINSHMLYEKSGKEAIRKRRQRERARTNMKNSVKNYVEQFIDDSTMGIDISDPNLLKPVVIRTKKNGEVEMEDHDETYNITGASVRQECDDLCQCMDKMELLEQKHDASSSIYKGKQEFIVHFTLLPEHQTFTSSNKVIYKCDICDSFYNHAFSLKRHYLGIHINHRYLSKDDVKHCQLETFHNGANAESYENSVKCENGIFSPENPIISNSSITSIENLNKGSGELAQESMSPIDLPKDDPSKETNSLLEDSTDSLLCNETLLDSSTDENKNQVPTLSSLAQSQVEKNKSSLSPSSLTTKNNNLVNKNGGGGKHKDLNTDRNMPNKVVIQEDVNQSSNGTESVLGFSEENVFEKSENVDGDFDLSGKSVNSNVTSQVPAGPENNGHQLEEDALPSGDDNSGPIDCVSKDSETDNKGKRFEIDLSQEESVREKAEGEDLRLCKKSNEVIKIEKQNGEVSDKTEKEENGELPDERLNSIEVGSLKEDQRREKKDVSYSKEKQKSEMSVASDKQSTMDEPVAKKTASDMEKDELLDKENLVVEEQCVERKDIMKECQSGKENRVDKNGEETKGGPMTQSGCISNISQNIGEKPNVSVSQAILPIPTNLVHTPGINQAQQQFLLLVPIMSSTSKPAPINASTLPQSQSGVPLVVISQVQTSTTNIQLQSSAANTKLCPQILAGHNQTLPLISSTASAPVQSFALISHNNSPVNILQSMASSKAASLTGKGVVVTSKPTDLKKFSQSRPPSTVSQDTLKSVQVKEAEQPVDLYRCHMCVLVYKTMSELKHHIKNDPHRFKGGLKQYACPQCSVRFRNKTNLARHNLMHHQTEDDKDRKFRCLTCGKGFTTETYLKMHARFHLGKSFPCKYGCVNVYFPNAGSLVKHLRAVHPGLDLKGYLREKARQERLKRLNVARSEYSIDHPGVGFQAKRGRPKGSKNIPKEFKLFSSNNSSSFTPKPFAEQKASVTEASSSLEKHQLNRNYFPTEKPRQMSYPFLIQKDRNLHAESTPEYSSAVQRRFKCKICDASFLSYLYLLKHRTKRHGADQSVQEFLFEMTKNVTPSCSGSESLQFSPPPSPKTFFSNVNQRGAENMSKYIEGGADMLKRLQKSQSPTSTPPQLEWTLYNFPPCFKYVRDCTAFYNGALGKQGTSRKYEDEPKVEHCDSPEDVKNSIDNAEDKEEQEVKKDETDEKNSELKGSEKTPDSVDGTCKDDVNENNTEFPGRKDLSTSENEGEEKCRSANPNSSSLGNINKSMQKLDKTLVNASSIESYQVRALPPNVIHDLSTKDDDLVGSVSAKEIDYSDANSKAMLSTSVPDKFKGNKRSPKKDKAETHDLLNKLNKFSLKALDLEISFKYFYKHLSPNYSSMLDSLNLFSKEGLGKKWSQKSYCNRKRKGSFTTNQLLTSKKLCKSRDQLFSTVFSSPDLSKHEPRRFSIWQGPNCSKIEETKASDKFSCPVVESVRQQNVMKRRKEISENNAKEEIELKPKQKNKEDFATNFGLMSRREYERSYHVLEKTEHCIKAPEIWETYNRIWFGKKGTITVVCSICHRHFSCLELCLRHQIKKHPHIEPSSLALEKGNYVEDMYYYYPMPYGILAHTQLIDDKLPPPEVYVCSRCRFPFKNINKLHSHMVLCDPNNDTASKNTSVNVELKQTPIVEQEISKNVTATQTHHRRHPRQRTLTSKFVNYQMYKSSMVNSRDISYISSGNKIGTRNPSSAINTKSQNFINFTSGLPRRKRNQHGLLYNPSNHTRRRELYHVLDQHQCHGCNLKFKSMSLLERHVKNCSGKDKLQNQKPLLSGVADEVMLRKQHTCRYCNKRFTFIKGVDLHYKRICSIRKIREEENQLTAEDLAHEAELERIIEHLKWSKSLNKDSSDIIQGHVKVEEDGTLTRIDKKRGRPFGTGKRIKKKGFRWTTLKHHVHEEVHSVSSSGQSTPMTTENDQNTPSSSLDEKRFKESLEKALANKITKTNEDSTGKEQVTIEKLEENKTSISKLDSTIRIPRKRGRPFKIRDASLPLIPLKPKRKRGRPRKEDEADKSQPEFDQEAQKLKDTIKFKRRESAQKRCSDFGSPNTKKSPGDKGKKIDRRTMQTDSKFSSIEHPNGNISTLASRKRKIEQEMLDTEKIVKPPARVRGRPKKFDPSDMESSYKKKKKTDPGYVPFVRSTSRDNLKTSSQIGTMEEDLTTDKKLHSDKKQDKTSVITDKKDITITVTVSKSNEEIGGYKEPIIGSWNEEDLNKNNSKSPQLKEGQLGLDSKKTDKNASSKCDTEVKTQTWNRSFQISVEKSSDSVKVVKLKHICDDNQNSTSPEKKSVELPVCKPSESPNNSKHPSSPRQKPVVLKKRKKDTSSLNDTESKSANGKGINKKAIQSKPEHEEPDKKHQPKSPKIGQPEGKVPSGLKTHHVSVSLPSTSPVAVRIVTIPASAAQQLSSLGGMKVIKSHGSSPPLPSKMVSLPTSSSVYTTAIVSSPAMKLAFTSPQRIITNKTQISPDSNSKNTVTSTTNATTSEISAIQTKNNQPPLDSKSVIQPSAFPMAQVIPIENGNLLIPSQAVQTGLTPRFIIQPGSMKTTAVSGNQGPMKIPVSDNATSTRHMAPSVILSTGKVAPVAGTIISGGKVTLNSGQGNKVMKIGNLLQTAFPSSPRPGTKKGKALNSPPSTMTGVTPSSRPMYYVQTSPLSNQVVMDISSLKTGDKAASAGSKQVLMSLGGDGKAKVMDRIAVPQLQFIPVSLVQGVNQSQAPNQGNVQTEPVEDKSDDGNALDKDKS